MRRHAAWLLLALSLAAYSVPESARAGKAEAGLWRKALDIYRLNRDWYPEKIAIHSEVLNSSGRPTSITKLLFALHIDAGGQLRAELERAQKNGEDTTAVMRSKVQIRNPKDGVDPDDEETYFVSISDSPFDPEHQEAVVATASGEQQTLFGRCCRRFDFSYRTAIVRKGKREQLIWAGFAWLEEGSGIPVKLEFSVLPLPRRIRSLWTIYLYDTARPDRWVLKKATISGHGGFLFIKKHFHTTTTFTGYRRSPAKEATK